MKNTIYLIIAVLAVLFATTESFAQSFYGPQGQYLGQATQNGNTTSYYGPQGQYQGQATTNNGTTSFYNAQGGYQGYYSAPQPTVPQPYYMPPQIPQIPQYNPWR